MTQSPWGGYPEFDHERTSSVPGAAHQGPEVYAYVTPKRRRSSGAVWLVLGGAIIVALVVGLLGGMLGARLVGSSSSTTSGGGTVQPLPQASGDTSPRADGTIAAIVKAALPTVVSILIDSPNGSGNGSGFVIRQDGYILTNNHVVEMVATGGGTLQAVFNDGTKVKATIVGRNPSYDLAVVKVDRTGLSTVTLGDSGAVQVGDTAIAIGAPLGLDGTVTSGIVSALDRPVTAGQQGSDESYINAIQTDAAINPGNSGGPLLDGKGQVIGVNSAIATLASGGQAGSIGLGFAIPANTAKRVAEEIIATGSSTNPIMGVSLDLRYSGDGAKIQQVTPGGPADVAGLETGDVVVNFDGRSIADSTELVVAIRSHAPGSTVPVTVDRGGQELTVDVTLGSSKA